MSTTCDRKMPKTEHRSRNTQVLVHMMDSHVVFWLALPSAQHLTVVHARAVLTRPISFLYMEGRTVGSHTGGGDLPYCDSFYQNLGRRSSENEHLPKQARVDRINAEFTSHLVDDAVSMRCCCPLAATMISLSALIADISLAPHVAQAVQQCLVLPIRSCFLGPSAAPRS